MPLRERPLKPPFTERVTVRVFHPQVEGKPGFMTPHPGVPALRKNNRKGKPHFVVQSIAPVTGRPGRGSEITDSEGVTWLVGRIQKAGGRIVCAVTRKG